MGVEGLGWWGGELREEREDHLKFQDEEMMKLESNHGNRKRWIMAIEWMAELKRRIKEVDKRKHAKNEMERFDFQLRLEK